MSAVGPVGLRDDLGEVLAEPSWVMPRSNHDVVCRHVGELVGVVLTEKIASDEVLADLVGVDVERRGEVDVADVVVAE